MSFHNRMKESPFFFSNQSSLGCFFHPLDISSLKKELYIAKVMGTSHIHKMTRVVGLPLEFGAFSPICWQVEMTQDPHDMNIAGSSKCVYKMLCLFHQKTYHTKKANILNIWMIQVYYYNIYNIYV